MAIFSQRKIRYKPQKQLEVKWNDFRLGLNTLLNANEIKGNELAQADNLILTGLGTPTKRWGYSDYFMAGATGAVRSIGAYYNGSTNELLAITDYGYLTKKSGASYTIITGASWPSGYEAVMTQLDNKEYIVSEGRELTRYNGTSLVNFATIATPATSGISNLSGASGIGELTKVSYRISAEGRIGETLGSSAVGLASVQADPTQHRVRVVWTAVSAASGDLTGYNVFGREPGYETFMAKVNSDTLTFEDDGTNVPSQTINPPIANTTGGPKAKFVVRYKDRLISAGIDGDPTRVTFSGRVPNQEKFHWSYGGGYILIDPDSGENITGLAVAKSSDGKDQILVFKERSIWTMTISSITLGETVTIADPQYSLLTASHGCVSNKTLAHVEDDIFFLSRKGVYAIGFKPQLLNILSTTEISAKVRDKFESINADKWNLASAEYKDNQYVLAYPEAGQNYANKILSFDRERSAWMGPWNVALNNLFKYYDSNNKERLVFGSNSTPYVYDFSSDYNSDNGTAIKTLLRTRKEDFGAWELFKTLKDVFTRFRDVTGTVYADIFIDSPDGTVLTAKNFNITPSTGNSGWGSFMFGNFQWGDSEESAGSGDTSEIFRWADIMSSEYSSGRSIQLQIKTTGRSDNYKLLGAKLTAQFQGKGSIPDSERV